MTKYACVTKEKYEKMYKTDQESDTREDLSVGEDLETFIRKIKDGHVNKDTIPEDGDHSETFSLCLLKKEDRRKLEQKDSEFMKTFPFHLIGKADVPEAEWTASESNLKFEKSKCYRETYSIDT